MDRAAQQPTVLGQEPELDVQISLCANCVAPAPGKFCASCGQETRERRFTVRGFTADLLEETLSLDSRLVHSLPTLLFRPGRLTSEYLAGRRASYIRPLKLYLAASILFFLSLSLPGARPLIRLNTGVPEPAAIQPPADSATAPLTPPTARSERADRFAARAMDLVAQGPEQLRLRMAEGIQTYMPRAMFLLLPVFALLLRILYRRSGRYYGEHIVFALHFHAFLFFALAVAVLAPVSPLRWTISAWCVLYLFLALKRVFGQPAWKTAIKFSVLAVSYLVLQSFAGLAIMLLVLLL